MYYFACNTATAAGLKRTKEFFDIPITGIIEPREATTINGKIVLVAIKFTVNSKAYHKEIKRINPKIEIFANPCPKFTSLVESGQFEKAETYQAAKEYLKPIKDAQIDTLILGCTHYPFLQKGISDIMGTKVKLVNPAYNAVLDLKKILEEKHLLKIGKNRKENYYTSGNPDSMKRVAKLLFSSFEYSIEKVKF